LHELQHPAVPYLILELGSHFPAKKLIEFNSWRERERERERGMA